MKTLSIRGVPDEVYSRLAEWAKENRRSLQEQVRYVLEQEVRLNETSVMAAAAEYRVKLAGRDLGNVVEDVRKDRRR